jgi:translation initiation factor 5B
VKADTLGSLEAVANALAEAEVPIMRAEVGDVAPRDVSVASTIEERTQRVILGFNVETLPDAERRAGEQGVEVFTDDVIYQLVEDYEAFVESIEREQREAVIENVVRPARIRLLPDHTFRQSDPAVVGVEVEAGTLKRNVPVARFEDDEPVRVGVVNGIQNQGDDVESARAGERVSAAIEGPTVGRQIEEGDVLWVDLPEKHARVLEQELTEELAADEQEALATYLETRRNRDPFWGK